MMRCRAFLVGGVIAASTCGQDLPGESVYAIAADAVVQVGVEDDLGRKKGGGSGVILKDSAWLVTNYHIFEKGGMLAAEKDGQPLHLGSIVRSDSKLDILIFKVIPETFPETWAKIPDLELARYATVLPGQRVYAIGSPFGLDNTITDGVLSGKRADAEMDFRLLQISAPISPGSSGGGVFDARGRLMGISTFIYRPGVSQNLNFALAIDEVLDWDRTRTRLDIRTSERHPEYVSGVARWRAHDCAGAMAHFRKVPENSGQKAEALYFTGRCQHRADEFKAAKVSYEAALRHDPRLARAHAFLSTLLYQDGDLLGAFTHQEKAFMLDPSLRDAKVAVNDW